MIATGKPVVLVLSQGRPRIITSIADRTNAIITAMNPGNEGGRAIADVLFGDHVPDGKLPFTYPRSPGYLTTYDTNLFENVMDARKRTDFMPLFEFGHGLSYTTFEYSDLKVSPETIASGGSVNVSVKITNTGKRAGKETVILYLRDEVAAQTPPAKRVRRFAKIFLRPGTSETLSFSLDPADLSYTASNNRPVIEPGGFTVLIGGLSARFTLK